MYINDDILKCNIFQFVEPEIEPERPVELEKPAQKPVEKPVEESKNLVEKSDEKTVKSTGFPDDAKSDDKQTDKVSVRLIKILSTFSTPQSNQPVAKLHLSNSFYDLLSDE